MFSRNGNTYYSCAEVQALIDLYISKGGFYLTIEEGVLGLGFSILCGNGLKTTIIKEKPLNSWSSTHTIRMYNKCPEKYQRLIDENL